MKMNLKRLVFIASLSIILGGCSQEIRQSVATPSASPTPMASAEKQTEKKETPQATAGKKSIIDMAGRQVEIPTEIHKVFAPSQIGIVMLYTINPDKLAGWNFALKDGEKKYINEKYYNLPVLGSWSGKNGTGNIEEIIKAAPDVIISVGTIDDSQKALSDKIQKQTGIPVVMVDAPLDKQDEAYTYIGELLGEQERCQVLADYCKKTITKVKSEVDKIPANEKVKVYYAEGDKGLQTDPSGSMHTEVLDFIGGINVADVKGGSGYGRAEVSLEQVLSWNPDVIITGFDKEQNGGFFGQIYNDTNWSTIQAVKDKKVYQIPCYPYDWFDRPPSVARILGIEWLGNLLYPNYIEVDMSQEVKTFYKTFYNKDLTDADVLELLQNAGA